MSDVKMSSVKWCDHIQIYLAPYRGYFCLLSRKEGNEADISGVLAGAKLLGDGLKGQSFYDPVPGPRRSWCDEYRTIGAVRSLSCDGNMLQVCKGFGVRPKEWDGLSIP